MTSEIVVAVFSSIDSEVTIPHFTNMRDVISTKRMKKGVQNLLLKFAGRTSTSAISGSTHHDDVVYREKTTARSKTSYEKTSPEFSAHLRLGFQKGRIQNGSINRPSVLPRPKQRVTRKRPADGDMMPSIAAGDHAALERFRQSGPEPRDGCRILRTVEV